MPGRTVPLVENEVYHVFNLGIDHLPTFTDVREYTRFIELLDFYRYSLPPMRFSFFLDLSLARKNELLEKMRSSNKLVDILCYCLMPNHFHLLLRQTHERGISAFLSVLQNSFTRYFNTKHKRIGSLFLDQFKAVRIETEEQLMHVSRYIHLNPYTGYVVKDLIHLQDYQWSSFREYLNQDQRQICQKEVIMSHFKDRESYKQFVFDHADYQREINKIKHLILELK